MSYKQFYVGLDVHKNCTTYAVRNWEGNIVKEGECSSFFRDLWPILEPYSLLCKITLEASTYFYPLYDGFKAKGVEVAVANTIQIRRLIAKSDRLDARRLSDMLRLNALPESFIPGEKIKDLRSLCVLRYSFVCECTKLKNQIHACLASKGIKIPVRTPFCKKWCAILETYIREQQPFEVTFLYDAERQAEKRIESIDVKLLSYVEQHFSETSKILMSIPGIGPIWSAFLIAQIGTISRFANKKKLRRYAGVVPVRDESAHKIGREYLPKSSSRTLLRLALVQAAQSAVKTPGPLHNRFHKKKREGKTHQQAIMCVASSLSDILFHVLTTGKPYGSSSMSGDVRCPIPSAG